MIRRCPEGCGWWRVNLFGSTSEVPKGAPDKVPLAGGAVTSEDSTDATALQVFFVV